jgi:hypothetical protein
MISPEVEEMPITNESPFGIAGLQLDRVEQLELAAKCGVSCIQCRVLGESVVAWNETEVNR